MTKFTSIFSQILSLFTRIDFEKINTYKLIINLIGWPKTLEHKY